MKSTLRTPIPTFGQSPAADIALLRRCADGRVSTYQAIRIRVLGIYAAAVGLASVAVAACRLINF